MPQQNQNGMSIYTFESDMEGRAPCVGRNRKRSVSDDTEKDGHRLIDRSIGKNGTTIETEMD